MSRKILLIIILLSASGSIFADEILESFEEENLPILNEELRKTDKDIEAAKSDIVTNATDIDTNATAIAAITEGLWEVDGTEHELITADEIDMQSKKIINVTDPASAQDAATKNYIDVRVPSGIIVMWSGTLVNVPTGWSLCDGTGGTPDLRDDFIMGWSNGVDPATKAAGNDCIASHAHIGPSHTHSGASHSHNVFGNAGEFGEFVLSAAESNEVWDGSGTIVSTEAGTTGSGGDVATTSTGTATFYQLAFIMKD